MVLVDSIYNPIEQIGEHLRHHRSAHAKANNFYNYSYIRQKPMKPFLRNFFKKSQYLKIINCNVSSINLENCYLTETIPSMKNTVQKR